MTPFVFAIVALLWFAAQPARCGLMSAVDEQSGSTGTGAVAARPPSQHVRRAIVNAVVVVVVMLFAVRSCCRRCSSNYWVQILTSVVDVHASSRSAWRC